MMVKTKIIATVGPSSSSLPVLRRMMRSGLDVVRLNFSHGTYQECVQRIKMIRGLNKTYKRHMRVLCDLEGHRIRIGALEKGQPIALRKGQILYLAQGDFLGSATKVPFDYKGPLKVIKKGQAIYIDDGNIFLIVEQVLRNILKTKVMVAGLLKPRKGVNMPGARLEFGPISSKDKADIEFSIKQKADFIAQSFVRTDKDVHVVRDKIGAKLPGCKIIAKIENRDGIRNIDSIIDASDGIMVARGDMGVSIPFYEVPIVQKMIIAKCNAKKKFVITATQMLEHMVDNRIPTRAEAADVANAVLDGTDYVMLSAETASGAYPVEALDAMNKIIKFTEQAKIRKACDV
ncbi:MAG: pyruvate kinase [Candidatus Omnitrophota bacterium]